MLLHYVQVLGWVICSVSASLWVLQRLSCAHSSQKQHFESPWKIVVLHKLKCLEQVEAYSTAEDSLHCGRWEAHVEQSYRIQATYSFFKKIKELNNHLHLQKRALHLCVLISISRGQTTCEFKGTVEMAPRSADERKKEQNYSGKPIH